MPLLANTHRRCHQWDLQWPPHCLPPRHPHPICYPTPLARNSNSSDCHCPNLSTARILRPLPRNQHLSSPQLSFTGVRLLRTWPGQVQDTKTNHERSHPAKATSSLLALLGKPALCQHKPGGESGAPNPFHKAFIIRIPNSNEDRKITRVQKTSFPAENRCKISQPNTRKLNSRT